MRCIKLTPYRDQATQSTYIDSDVIIPLREVDEYLIAIQDKEANQKHFRTSMSNQKDQTKYNFQDTIYGKGRLVLAVLQDYVKIHPSITFEELQTLFPKTLQGSLNVVDLEENIKDIKRYYYQESEILHLTDQTALVCSQWGIGNINQFIEQAQKLYNNSDIIQEMK